MALITNDNREQCTCSRGLVYALSYVGSFGTVCPSVVSCILYQSSGTSRGSLPHCRVPALCYLIEMQLSNVSAAVHSPMGDTTGTIPLHCLLPRKYFVSDRRTSVMMLNLDGYGDTCGNCVPLGTYVCSPCHIILSVLSSFLRILVF